MDKLKDFLDQNEEEFRLPPDLKEDIWAAIEAELPSKAIHKRTVVLKLWQIAASVAVLIVSGLWALQSLNTRGGETAADPQLNSIREVHASLISSYHTDQITAEDELTGSFIDLVNAEKEILEDLENTPAKLREKAIEALKINYENQLILLEEIENQKNIINTFKSIAYEDQSL